MPVEPSMRRGSMFDVERKDSFQDTLHASEEEEENNMVADRNATL